MTAEEIRKITEFRDARMNVINALDSSTAFWLREIAAQLAEQTIVQREAAQSTVVQLNAMRDRPPTPKVQREVMPKAKL